MSFPVVEKFVSINGESICAGEPVTLTALTAIQNGRIAYQHLLKCFQRRI